MCVHICVHCLNRSNSYSSPPESGITVNIYTVTYLETSGFSLFGNLKPKGPLQLTVVWDFGKQISMLTVW